MSQPKDVVETGPRRELRLPQVRPGHAALAVVLAFAFVYSVPSRAHDCMTAVVPQTAPGPSTDELDATRSLHASSHGSFGASPVGPGFNPAPVAWDPAPLDPSASCGRA